MRPKLWLVAGPNGAGKSTLVQSAPLPQLLSGVSFWNPDTVALECLHGRGFDRFSAAPVDEQRKAFLQAATEVEKTLTESVSQSVPVGVETVLSSDKYQQLVESVAHSGGFIGLVYVALQSPELACRRVAQRVREGGHGVPEDKIKARWHRSLSNLPWFALRASQFFVFDNSDSNPANPPLLIAYGSQGIIRRWQTPIFPELASALAHLPHE